MFHWFTAKRANIPPATPPFQDILTRISLSIYMVPNLPSHIYQLISSKPKLLINARQDNDNTVATGMSTLTSGSLLCGSQLPGLQFPGLTGLTTSSQLTGLLSGGLGISSWQGSLTQNPAVDSSLQALLPTVVKIRDLLGNGKGPLMEDGSPMCISFLDNAYKLSAAAHIRLLHIILGPSFTKTSLTWLPKVTRLFCHITLCAT